MFRLTCASGGCRRLIPSSSPATNFHFDLPLCDSRPQTVTSNTSLNRPLAPTSSAKCTRNLHQLRASNIRCWHTNPSVDFINPVCFLRPRFSDSTSRSNGKCFHTDRTHYEILGIDKDATSDDIRAAFLKKSKECHPDTNSLDPDNHRQFVLVNEAYSILSKPHSRRDYDISLVHGIHRPMHNRPMSHTQDTDEYYHYQELYKDFTNRKANYDKDHVKKPYYGIPGLSKVPNSKIVLACLVWMILGIVLHFVAVKKSSTLHIKVLDERDAAIHEMWMKAKKDAELFRQNKQDFEASIKIGDEKT